NYLPTTTISTLSLHDALPISSIDPFLIVPRVVQIPDDGSGLWWNFVKDRERIGLVHTIAAEARTNVKLIKLAFADTRQKTLPDRSEEHTSELQSRFDLVCRLL